MAPVGKRDRAVRTTVAGLLLTLSGLLAACGGDDVDTIADPTELTGDELAEAQQATVRTLRAHGMDNLASAVEQLDLVALAGSDEYTLLGPQDTAFLSLSADGTADLLADPTALEDLLRHHLIPRRIDTPSLQVLDAVETAAGTTLPVSYADGVITVGSATVVGSDIPLNDGVVHVIDEVLPR